jgi:hypothetical protein
MRALRVGVPGEFNSARCDGIQRRRISLCRCGNPGVRDVRWFGVHARMPERGAGVSTALADRHGNRAVAPGKLHAAARRYLHDLHRSLPDGVGGDRTARERCACERRWLHGVRCVSVLLPDVSEEYCGGAEVGTTEGGPGGWLMGRFRREYKS